MSDAPDVDADSADSQLEGLLSPDEAESVRQRSAAVGAAVGAIVGGRRGPVAAGVGAGAGAAAGYLVGALLTPTRDDAVLDATDPALGVDEAAADDADDGPVRIDIEDADEAAGDGEDASDDGTAGADGDPDEDDGDRE